MNLTIDDQDALLYIVRWVREGQLSDYSSYGYDVYIPNVIRNYLRTNHPDSTESDIHRANESLSASFYDAAWGLCRRGILRPGVKRMGQQSTNDGSAGDGYSITVFGTTWMAESDRDTFVPTEPGPFANMLKPYSHRFGAGFQSRAQEAVRCYGAHAYLAACTMSGAAAESILLATAIAKSGDEEKVLKNYTSANGRARVSSHLLGQATERLKREFDAYTSLLKYWRDEASHGKPSQITDNEAYTSLAMLLRFAMFVNDNWTDLTGQS